MTEKKGIKLISNMMTPFEAHILIQQNDSNSFQTLEATLKSKRLNPNITFKKESLLVTAIKRNAPNPLKLLLQHGANPDLKSYENGRYESALITAVRMKSLTSVKILLSHGASLYTTNFYGSDAIFQAVHENAFDILDHLLREYEPKRSYYHSRQLYYASPPSLCSPNSIVFQRATTSKEATLLHLMKQGSSTSNKAHDGNCNWEDDDDHDDHILCPFYYALNQAVAFSCKRESLIRLLQSYYRCKCLEEIASCCGNSIGPRPSLPLPPWNWNTAPKPTPTPPPTPNHYSHPHGESSLEKDAIREYLAWLGSSSSSTTGKSGSIAENPETHNNFIHGSINTSSPSPPATLDNGKYIKLVVDGRGSGNELSLYPYKIYKIEGKCHAIKENESSSSSASGGRGLSSSYLVLVGPLKLSYITREVIRDQIMFCSRSYSTPTSSKTGVSTSGQPSPFANSQLAPANTATVASGANNNFKVGKVKLFPSPSRLTRQELRGEGKNFHKSLETLMIPSTLQDYILYKELNSENEHRSIQLIKKDLVKNINYFALHII